MNGKTDSTERARVFLRGDGIPFYTTLTPDQVLAKIADAEAMARAGRLIDSYFLRLPYADGQDVLVRPDAIAAILPPPSDDDEE